VNYGLKSFAHVLVTLNFSPPSSGSVPSWLRMYSMITSSVTLPLEATKYPRAQKWRPQNCFWMCLSSIIIFRDVLPLMYCMILLGERFEGQDNSTCTWSGEIEPCKISISCDRQISRTSSRTRIPTSPVKTRLRYFVIHTKWYLMS